MKKLLILSIGCGAIALLSGCMSLSKVVEQLKDDPATVDLTIQTVYGNLVLHRSVPAAQSAPATNSDSILVTPNTTLKAD